MPLLVALLDAVLLAHEDYHLPPASRSDVLERWTWFGASDPWELAPEELHKSGTAPGGINFYTMQTMCHALRSADEYQMSRRCLLAIPTHVSRLPKYCRGERAGDGWRLQLLVELWNWNLEFFYRLIGEARGELGLVATIGTGLRRDDWPLLAVGLLWCLLETGLAMGWSGTGRLFPILMWNINDDFSATGDQNKSCCDQQIWYVWKEYEYWWINEKGLIFDLCIQRCIELLNFCGSLARPVALLCL